MGADLDRCFKQSCKGSRLAEASRGGTRRETSRTHGQRTDNEVLATDPSG